MTMEQLIAASRARLDAAIAERTIAQAGLIELRERAANDDPEVTREVVAAAIVARDAIDARIDAARTEVDQLVAEQARDAELSAMMEATVATQVPSRTYEQVARVGAEQRTYGQHNDPRARGRDFMTDVIAEFRGSIQARQRLERHTDEMRVDFGARMERAVGTANFTGWVIPQYLVDLNAPAAMAGRQFADICRRHDLPETGMTAYLSKITAGSTVADQAASGNAVSEQDMDDTQIPIAVRTAAGSQSVSRQAIERGLGVDEIVFGDLLGRYNGNLDNKLLNAATSGLTNVATSVAYTDTTPSAVELYPKILAAASGAEGVFLNRASSLAAVMHPRRWRWMSAAMVSTWPLISGQGAPAQSGGSTLGLLGEQAGKAVRGYLPDGTPVVTDANVATNLGAATNEDEIYVVAPEECHLWEDPNAPLLIRAETAKNLLIDLVVYGYYAFYLDRYTGGHQKVAGTGLITPVFA